MNAERPEEVVDDAQDERHTDEGDDRRATVIRLVVEKRGD